MGVRISLPLMLVTTNLKVSSKTASGCFHVPRIVMISSPKWVPSLPDDFDLCWYVRILHDTRSVMVGHCATPLQSTEQASANKEHAYIHGC